MTMTARAAKPTRSHATARSRYKSQSSSRVNFSTTAMAVCQFQLRIGLQATASANRKISVRLSHEHERRLESVVHLELVENVGQMGFYRFFADKYFFADFFISQSFGNESQNLHLPLGQRLDALVELAWRFQRTRLSLNDFFERFPGRDFLIDPASAVVHDFN